MTFTFLGNLAIILQGERDSTDEEARACLTELAKKDINALRALVITDGGAPTPAQRQRLNKALDGRDYPSAVVSNNVMARGIVTALGWFNKKIRAFHPDNTEEAFRYLEISTAEYPRVWAEIYKLETELGAGKLRSIVRRGLPSAL